MIHDVEEYVKFFNSVRKRTMQYVKTVPNEMLAWKPADNKFSTGDLLRHLASTQLMFLRVLEQGDWSYPGHDRSKGETIDEITKYFEECHMTFNTGLLTLGNELLAQKVTIMHGHPVSAWRIMMACVEHEIHHRGQLSTYLQLNNLQPPQIFGLKIEQVGAGEGSDPVK